MSSEPGTPDVVSILLRARAAYERRDWTATYDDLSGLNPDDLHNDDYPRLAAAAYLTGRTNECVQALQRAYQVRLDDGAESAAARCAFWLAQVLRERGEHAIAAGWVARIQRLLDGIPDDVVEGGYLALLEMFRLLGSGEIAAAAECAEQVTEYGRRFDDADLLAVGMASRGRLALFQGDVRSGLALLDEAMVGVDAGAVSPIFAGQVYCMMIEGCQQISDFARAAEWTLALSKWCDQQPGLLTYTGQCAVHRGQIMRIRGRFLEALGEFTRAVERYLSAGTAAPAGLALTERGDVLRCLGDLDAADESYRQARGHGFEPQPGLALLWLARGRTVPAANAVRRLVAERPDAVGRSALLPAAVRILLAAGEVDGAEQLSRELDDIAADFDSAGLMAAAGYAAGSVALARDDAARALPQLRAALGRWTQLGAPYEAARCEVMIGRALRALGDEESALAEFATAENAFAELGAEPARREVAGLRESDTAGGLSERELEVLALVARGQTNAEVADTLTLSEKTVARHLSNIFTKLNVTSRTAAAAFAFDHHIV